MKISALEVVGFGVWSRRTFTRFSGGLNVFYGPNEAGKTTLMEFIRGMMYGFTGERRGYLPPVSGGPAGGRLEMIVPNGTCTIERFLPWESMAAAARSSTANYAARTQTSVKPGDVERTRFFRNEQGTEDAVEIRFGIERFAFTAPDGRRQNETEFRSLISHVDERIFKRVFCVGIDELRELESLHESEVAAMLYQISVGTDRVSLFDVLKQLRDARRSLLDPESGLGEIATLFGQRETLKSEIVEACGPAKRFPELLLGRDRLDQEIAALESDLAGDRDEERRCEAALAVRDRWKKRASLDKRIGNFPKISELPIDSPDRLVRFDLAVEERQKALAELEKQRSKLRDEAGAMRAYAPLERNASKIEALAEQEPWIVSLAAQIQELRNEIHELETQLDEDRRGFGLEPKVFATLRRTSLATLQRPAEQLAQSRITLDRFEPNPETETEIAALRKELSGALSPRGASRLDDAIEMAGDMVTSLRRRIQLEEDFQETRDQADRAERRAAESRELQMLPLQTLTLLGISFAAGVFLMILCVLTIMYGSSPLGEFRMPSGFLGLALTVGAMIGKVSLEKTHRGTAEAYIEQAERLRRECDSLQEQCDRFDRDFPSHQNVPWNEQLTEAEAELTELEKLIPTDARLQEIENEQRATLAERNSAQMELDAARQRWISAVRTAGLPDGMTPRQVKDLLDNCERIEEMRLRLERARNEYSERTREQQMLHGRIGALVVQVDPDLEHEEPIEIVRTLASRLFEQAGLRERRHQVVMQLRRLHKQKLRHDSAVTRLRRKRRAFLDQLGVRDAEELQLRIADQIELGNLHKQRTMLQREIDAGLAGRFREEEIQPLLEPVTVADQLDAKLEQIRRRIRETEHRRTERLESRGRLQVQIQTLAADSGASEKLVELEQTDRALRQVVRRWKTLAVAHGALERVRQNYEQTRQPETLREASEYMKRFTRGRYVRVWTPLRDDVLFIDDQHGRSFLVEQLSRGTREQLFLCLRLALAASYARRGIAMPLVFDDVFVNFDTRRSEAAIEVLEDFAKAGHQIFVFTCHEHIAEIFRSHGIGIHRLGEEEPEEPVAESIADAIVEKIVEDIPEPEPEPQPQPELELLPVIPAPPKPEPPPPRRQQKRQHHPPRMIVASPPPPGPVPDPVIDPEIPLTGIDHLPPWAPDSSWSPEPAFRTFSA